MGNSGSCDKRNKKIKRSNCSKKLNRSNKILRRANYLNLIPGEDLFPGTGLYSEELVNFLIDTDVELEIFVDDSIKVTTDTMKSMAANLQSLKNLIVDEIKLTLSYPDIENYKNWVDVLNTNIDEYLYTLDVYIKLIEIFPVNEYINYSDALFNTFFYDSNFKYGLGS